MTDSTKGDGVTMLPKLTCTEDLTNWFSNTRFESIAVVAEASDAPLENIIFFVKSKVSSPKLPVAKVVEPPLAHLNVGNKLQKEIRNGRMTQTNQEL